MYTHYILILKSEDGDTTSIVYRLVNSQATHFWLSLFDLPSFAPPRSSVSFTDDIDITILNGFIDKYNTEGIIDDHDPIPRFKLLSLDEDVCLLNKIHSLFENYQLDVWTLAKTAKTNKAILKDHIICLDEINVNVHDLESKIQVLYGETSGLSSWISIPDSFSKAQIPARLNRLFQMRHKFGDLFIGYATRGKNLYDIWEDNDVDLLQQGGSATPQQYISRGTLSLFSGDKETKLSESVESESEEQIRARFYSWFDDNDLAQFGYDKESADNCLGYLKIGEFEALPFQHDWTYGEVVDYYKKYDKVYDTRLLP